MEPIKLVFLILAAVSLAQPLSAAAYCSVDSSGKHCWYHSAASCQDAAGSRACVLNEVEARQQPGGGAFCVIGPGGGWGCTYFARDTCERAAAAMRGTCAAR